MITSNQKRLGNETIPAELKQLSTWLTWRSVQKPGEPKPRKVPYYTNGRKRHGKQGGPEDRAALATFDAAVEAATKQGAAGVGLAMLADNGLVGLDFDDCIHELIGTIDERVLPLIEGTYAEVSPSGRGVRAFYRGEAPDGKENKDPNELKVELFHGTGYLTVTGNQLPEAPLTVAPLPDAVREYWARRKGSVAMPDKSAAPADRPQPRSSTMDELRAMLADRDPNASEKEWSEDLRVLHFETSGSAAGEQLANEWSRGSKKYTGPESIRTRWHSPSWSDTTTPVTIAHWLRFRVADTSEFPYLGDTHDVGIDTRPSATLAPDLPGRGKRPPFKFETLPEDVLTRVLPDRAWALYPYFPAGTVSILSSVGGFGKSHLMLLIAFCKALGLPDFCGRPCAPGRVVILTAEDDLEEMQRRSQRILRYLRNLNVEIDHALLRANLQLVDLTGGGAKNLMVRAETSGAIPTDLVAHIAEEIGKADMIVIDTLSRFSGASENDNTAGAVFISACETIAKLTGAAVLVLSHTGKDVARAGIVDQYVSRGASAFSDNARSVAVLAAPTKKAMKSLEIDAEAVERGDLFRLAHVKSNYAKKAPDAYFKRLDDGVVAPFIPTPNLAASVDELSMKLLAYIGKGGIRHSDVYKNFGKIFDGRATRDQATEVFDSAIRDGQLIRKRSYRNADYYGLADTSLASAIDAPMPSKEEAA